jgi:hypothetical protein
MNVPIILSDWLLAGNNGGSFSVGWEFGRYKDQGVKNYMGWEKREDNMYLVLERIEEEIQTEWWIITVNSSKDEWNRLEI